MAALVGTGAAGVGGPPPAVRRGPAFAQLAFFPRARSCAPGRTFVVRLRRQTAHPVSFGTVTVNGRIVRQAGAAKLAAALRLRSVPKGKLTVRVDLRTQTGFRAASVRIYTAC